MAAELPSPPLTERDAEFSAPGFGPEVMPVLPVSSWVPTGVAAEQQADMLRDIQMTLQHLLEGQRSLEEGQQQLLKGQMDQMKSVHSLRATVLGAPCACVVESQGVLLPPDMTQTSTGRGRQISTSVGSFVSQERVGSISSDIMGTTTPSPRPVWPGACTSASMISMSEANMMTPATTATTGRPIKRNSKITRTVHHLDSPIPVRQGSNLSLRFKAASAYVVESHWLDSVAGIVVFINCFLIGVEIQVATYTDSLVCLRATEHIFLAFYVLELMLRFHVHGIRQSLRSSWTVFDLIVVVVGCLSEWVVSPIMLAFDGSITDSDAGRLMERFMMLRVLRLLRLVRALRVIAMFQTLWRLVHGLMQSMSTILSTFALLTLAVYIFACIGVELLTKNKAMLDDPTVAPIIHEHFYSLAGTMMTLCRFFFMDAAEELYEPIVEFQPLMSIYFLVLTMLISITLMNLVTAVLVENVFNQSKRDEEFENQRLRKQVKSLLPQVRKLFEELDANGDGYLTKDEINEAWSDIPKELTTLLDSMTHDELFEELDSDNSGRVSKDVFVEGLISLALSDVSPQTTKMLHHLQTTRRQMSDITKLLRNLSGICLDPEKWEEGSQTSRAASWHAASDDTAVSAPVSPLVRVAL